VIGGGEPAHVQARLGDDRHGQLRADAGDLREPVHGRQGRGVLAVPGAGTGLPARVGAPGRGDGLQGGLDLVLDRGDGLVQLGGAVQVKADQHRVVAADLHALQGLLDAGPAGLDLPGGQAGQGLRVALAASDGFQDGAGRFRPGQRRQDR